MTHHKILFSGPVGAGKTTAIAAISDIAPVTTETRPTDETRGVKATTTVAMDYGVLRLDGAERIHLYGTPGQDRFAFMRHILAEGAIGVVLLVTSTRPTPLADLHEFIDSFRTVIDETALAVGVTGMDLRRTPGLDDYRRVLAQVGIVAPVFEIDARRRSDVALLVQALLLSIDPGLADGMSPPGTGSDTVQSAVRDYW
ncbi:GTP-binding protein [Parafrankia elaeagni]|uniref:GTP-binding protein n=1 Tax=Parafrankia elaeagni TaxID=222534 RepID=UPI0003A5CE79|nr:ATP/GTP-binding protein [Parafrankia elaeagni]